jgi:uncharacterized protein
MTARPPDVAFYPGRVPVDAYGNRGFRFAGMSHRGSILILPSGIYGWNVAHMAEARVESFARVFAAGEEVGFVLFGTGDEQHWPTSELERHFALAQIGLECMTTGAAVRTYNLLLAEGRRVAAALIAVDNPRAPGR